MELNNLKNNLENNLVNENIQKNFLESSIGRTISMAIDIGIRALLPDFLEDEIINIKNNLFEFGLKEGIKKTIDEAIDIGKSTIGVVTGNFESVNQMKEAIQSGGVIDNMSNLIDYSLNKIKNKGIINNNIANTIKQGKNIILRNIEKNIEKTFLEQIVDIENANKYINNWNEAFKNKNFNKMEIEYKKIKKQLEKIAPIEKTFENIRTIENIHNLIKNNGEKFNLTEEQLALASKL